MFGMRVPRGAALCLLLFLAACGPSTIRGEGSADAELSIFAPRDVATGSETFARISEDCAPGTSRCNKPGREPVIESASVDDPTIVELIHRANDDVLTLKALRDGVVTLKVAAASADGIEKKELAATIRVATPDRVTLEAPRDCAKPIRVATGAKFTIGAQLWRGATRLQGSPSPLIESDVATLPPDASSTRLELVAQSKRGVGSIRSTISETDALPVEVYDEDQVTSIVLTPSSSEQLGGHPLVKKGSSFSLDAKISVTTVDGGTSTLCAERLPTTITSDRPDVCTGSRVSWSSKIIVQTKEAGTCTLTVRVGETATATQTLEVREDARGF